MTFQPNDVILIWPLGWWSPELLHFHSEQSRRLVSYSLSVAEDKLLSFKISGWGKGSLTVSETKQHKCFNRLKIKTSQTNLAKAKTFSLPASLGVLISYLHSSSMRRVRRKAPAVSPGVVTKRLSRRLHIAERRGGVTDTHCLGRGAERGESGGSRGDAASRWPIIEIGVKIITIVFSLWLHTKFTSSYNQRKVPTSAKERQSAGEFP